MYKELDFIINSLRMSIESTDCVYLQIAWLVDLMIACYFKQYPNIVPNFRDDVVYEITSRDVKLSKYKKVWSVLYKCRNSVCHRGLYASVKEIKKLYDNKRQLAVIASGIGVDLNTSMLEEFVKKYCI